RQRLDDLEDVTAGAEIAAGAGDDDGAHVAGMRQRAEQVGEFLIAVEGERILLFRPVQRDGGDAPVLVRLEAEMFWRKALERAAPGLHRIGHVSLQELRRRRPGSPGR